MEDPERISSDYRSQLKALSGNDKITISSLTELADQNKKHYRAIAHVIIDKISQIPPEYLLSHLYLIDCILKNHTQPYKDAFEPEIVRVFVYAFSKANDKVRESLFKLRYTWNQIFTPFTLKELDRQVHKLDRKWPVMSEGKTQKILINPAKFQQGVPSTASVNAQLEEEETERMRVELLRKEKELLAAKRKALDDQLNELKHSEKNRTSGRGSSRGSRRSSDASNQAAESPPKSTSKKDDPHHHSKSPNSSSSSSSRDPRKRKSENSSKSSSRASNERLASGETKPSSSSSSGKHSSSSSGKDRKSVDSGRKSSGSSTSKSSSSTSSSSSSSRKSSSTTKSSSSSSKNSSDKDKRHQHKDSSANSKKPKDDKKSSSSSPKSTAASDNSGGITKQVPPALSKMSNLFGSEEEDMEMTPVRRASPDQPPKPLSVDSEKSGPPQFTRIPKLTLAERRNNATEDVRRGRKRSGEESTNRDCDDINDNSPPPDKRPKPLDIDMDCVDDDESGKSSPAIGWAKHKESNPDQYRTPIKEDAPFFRDQRHGGRGGHHEGRFSDGGSGGPDMENHPPRIGGNFRGGPQWFGRGGRGGMPWVGGFGGRGQRMDGRPRGRFGGGRGGRDWGYGGGPQGRNGPPPHHMQHHDSEDMLGDDLDAINHEQLFGLPLPPGLNLNKTDPDSVRKEVIPALIKLGEKGLQEGTISQQEFNEFLGKVRKTEIVSLKKSSKMREAEMKNADGMCGPEMNGNQIAPLRNDSAVSGSGFMPSKFRTDLPIASKEDVDAIMADPTKSMEIDGRPCFIRYYGVTATAVIEDYRICTISFAKEPEPREIVIDNHIRVKCRIPGPGQPHRNSEVFVNGNKHRIRIGAPKRELYVDGQWYECFFNSGISVRMGERSHSAFLKGAPPSVVIGDQRPDLCLGLIYYYLDERRDNTYPLYLDQKPQLMFIANKPHIVKFVADYKTFTINGHPFMLDFGEQYPKVISVGGCQHKLRFLPIHPKVREALERHRAAAGPPAGPGHPGRALGEMTDFDTADDDRMQQSSPMQRYSNNLRTNYHTDRGHISPTFGGPPEPESVQPPVVPPASSAASSKGSMSLPPLPPHLMFSHPPPTIPSTAGSIINTTLSMPGLPMPPTVSMPPHQTSPNAGIMTPALTTSGIPLSADNLGSAANSVTSPESAAATGEGEIPPPPAQSTNINELWARLQSSGVLSMFVGGGNSTVSSGIPGLESSVQPTPPAAVPATVPTAAANIGDNKVTDVPEEGKPTDEKRTRKMSVHVNEIVLKSHHPTIKERQSAVIDMLFGQSDLQCKSCGLRFGADEMTLYSSHLDWHFRTKRRERDNARKAQSRRWFFEKNDWIVSDEIDEEDPDMTEEEIILEQSLEVPTIPVDSTAASGGEETCPICYEVFSQIYKQGDGGDEEGSWHLHNAMRDSSGQAYHPQCYKDKEAQDRRLEMEDFEDEDEDMKDESADQEMLDSGYGASSQNEEDNEDAVKGNGDDVIKDDTAEDEKAVAAADSEESKGEPTEVEVAVDAGKVADDPKPEEVDEVEVVDDEDDGMNGGRSQDTDGPKGDPPTETADKSTEKGADAAGKDKNGDEEMKEGEDKDGNETEDKTLERSVSNTSLIEDMSEMKAPVVQPKGKVAIKLSITTDLDKDKRHSIITIDDDDDSEFDPDAVVVPPSKTKEEREAAKPKLAGRRFTVLPPQNRDTDMSGLCSIM